MAVESTMMPLGTTAPDFNLLDAVSGKKISLQQLKSNIATVIFFICNHCPYVKHIQHQLVTVAKKYQSKGIQFAGINANDPIQYPEDSIENMHEQAKTVGFTFPYLLDDTQQIAKNYQAACTPDFYIFDANLKCIYRGRFDDASPKNGNPVTGKDLTHALDNILLGKPIDSHQLPSIGCSIKWSHA